MTRSIYKADFINKDVERKIEKKAIAFIRTRNRNTTITSQMVGLNFFVYNGKYYNKFIIDSPNMIGHKLGEFTFTKRMGSFLHKKAKTEREYKKKIKLLAKKRKKTSKDKKKPKK